MITEFIKARRRYAPCVPNLLQNLSKTKFSVKKDDRLIAPKDQLDALRKIFKNTWGQDILILDSALQTNLLKIPDVCAVVLSGGQAPGGHNVICGLYLALKQLNPQLKLLGFKNGPSGILDDDYLEIDQACIDEYINTGGFNMLGSGRTKIETKEQFQKCKQVLTKHGCSGLVVIGGDDSNTNAALLAEYFSETKSGVQVIGVPKTIDGDLKNIFIETSFGFDTAVSVYSELISNISRDALSARKYYHFIRLMGRSASHITLESALRTQPNIAIIAEEIEKNSTTLAQLVEYIASVMIQRDKQGKKYGIVLIPEGVIEFIPEMNILLSELNDLMATRENEINSFASNVDKKLEFVKTLLSENSKKVFTELGATYAEQLLLDRDPHGNVQVSLIETEKLLISMLRTYFKKNYPDCNFGFQSHFLGYEGRSAAPTNFDANYAFALGQSAAALLSYGATGYMSTVSNLTANSALWKVSGTPLTKMINLEQRHAKQKPVIQKGLVDLNSKAFKKFSAERANWATDDCYAFVGPIQYFGPKEITDKAPFLLELEVNNDK